MSDSEHLAGGVSRRHSAANLSIVATLCAAALSGCSAQVLDFEIESFSKKCEPRGGISSISTLLFVNTARCRDGVYVSASRGKP